MNRILFAWKDLDALRIRAGRVSFNDKHGVVSTLGLSLHGDAKFKEEENNLSGPSTDTRVASTLEHWVEERVEHVDLFVVSDARNQQ